MRCPTCDVLLITEERLAVEIDVCPSCHGVWLERGELNMLLERSDGSSPLLPEAEPYATAAVEGEPDRAPAGRRVEQSYWMTVLNAD